MDAVNPKAVVDAAVAYLKSLPATLSGDDSPVENVWEEIKVQVQEEESPDWDAYLLTIRQAIEGALFSTPRVPEEAPESAPDEDPLDDEERVEDLVQDLLSRAGCEEINYAPFGIEYFVYKVEDFTVYAKVVARTGWDRFRIRGYSVAAPNGEEGEMLIDCVEEEIAKDEFESAKAKGWPREWVSPE